MCRSMWIYSGLELKTKLPVISKRYNLTICLEMVQCKLKGKICVNLLTYKFLSNIVFNIDSLLESALNLDSISIL